VNATLALRRPAQRLRLDLADGAGAQALALLAGIVLWQLAGMFGGWAWLPPLSAVLGKLGGLWADGELQKPLIESLGNLAAGYSISIVAGVAIGTLMALFPKVNYALRVYVNALLMAPSIVMAPIFFVFFGLSRWTLIAVILLYTIVFVIVNTYTAVTEVSTSLHEMAASFGASPRQVFFNVTIRAAGPLLLAGLRLGLARSVKGMINGEIFIALVGLGALDDDFDGSFDVAGILAIALVVVIIAVVTLGLLEMVNRRVNAWTQAS
jgi:NitT/TauT family transport system permease protein